MAVYQPDDAMDAPLLNIYMAGSQKCTIIKLCQCPDDVLIVNAINLISCRISIWSRGTKISQL